MPEIALATANAARDLDEDLPPLITALRARGAQVHTPSWDDEQVDWTRFDVVVLRSTWDYTMRPAEFLRWAERTAACTLLLNPSPVLRWNTDKHYLADLTAREVPVVPSAFIEPGENAAHGIDAFVGKHDCAEIVVKPAIGAGSRDTQRHARADRQAAVAHVQRLIDERRSVVVQPYLDRVDEAGETGLIYFAGRFSHAIRKGPLLRRGEEPTPALFAPEQITPREPGGDELHVAGRVMAAIPFETPLYARVDLIRDAGGYPCLLELELTEPSLFFAHAPGSAGRFAQTILDRLSAR